MTIFIVPKGELYRFASSLKRKIVSEIETPFKDAVICIENLTESKLKEVIYHTIVWYVNRDLVINDYSGKTLSHSELKIKRYLGIDYIKYWCNKLGFPIYPSTLKHLSIQCEFIGYDAFIQLLYRSYYLTNNSKKDVLLLAPSPTVLFEAIASRDMHRMVNTYFRLIKFYSSYKVNDFIHIFIERIISCKESKSLIKTFPKQYKNILELAVKNIPLTSIALALLELSNKYLPPNLKILLFFNSISHTSTDSSENIIKSIFR